MAFPKQKPEEIQARISSDDDAATLRQRAVAIDPPPEGAIGIQELLSRFEHFAEANDLTDPPADGQVGVRELLARLGNLAEAGYFSPAPDDSEQN
jgi:hypothetical protein